MKAKRTSTALVRSEVIVRDRATGKEKHREARETEVETGHLRSASPVVICKVGNGVKISMGYQSVETNVGVDLPWPMRPKNMNDVKEGFDAAYSFIDDELAARAKEMDGLLAKLAAKYKR